MIVPWPRYTPLTLPTDIQCVGVSLITKQLNKFLGRELNHQNVYELGFQLEVKDHPEYTIPNSFA